MGYANRGKTPAFAVLRTRVGLPSGQKARCNMASHVTSHQNKAMYPGSASADKAKPTDKAKPADNARPTDKAKPADEASKRGISGSVEGNVQPPSEPKAKPAQAPAPVENKTAEKPRPKPEAVSGE